MKFRTKAIRFRLWLYFSLFSMVILLVLGSIQALLIKPYYRRDRQEKISVVADKVVNDLLSTDSINNKKINEVNNAILNNNVCVVVYNCNGDKFYEADSLGDDCALNRTEIIDGVEINFKKEPELIYDKFEDSNTLSITYKSSLSNENMLIYGVQVEKPYETYNVLVNASLDPIDAYIAFMWQQYSIATIFIVIFSIIFAAIVTVFVGKPIVQMKQSADFLAKGEYDKANFMGGRYEEYQVLAETLNNATSQLSKIDELRKDLIANVSHDIKTPLTTIKAYAEMIKDISGENKEKRDEHLDIILSEVEYLDKLILDLQQLSKLQAGYSVLNKENFDLSEVVKKTVISFLPIVKDRKIDFIDEIDPSYIFADKLRITEVVKNFLSNAVKYSNDSTNIIVKVIDTETTSRFEVTDRGEIIEEENLPYIWDRYYKIDKKFKRSIKQTGLGLAISKAILDAHFAEYGCRSNEEEGTTFWFEIKKEYEGSIS